MTFFIPVSEYIPGGELFTLLDKYEKLPEELVKIFIAEIAVAIGKLSFCVFLKVPIGVSCQRNSVLSIRNGTSETYDNVSFIYYIYYIYPLKKFSVVCFY